MESTDLTFEIRGAAFTVHKELGPGLLESVYESALAYELMEKGLFVRTQVPLPVKYKKIDMQLGFRIDLLVEESIIVEIKSVESVHDVHKKQLLTYLRLSEKKVGLLINFNSNFLKDKESIFRIVN
jgi:GxxExxY protein